MSDVSWTPIGVAARIGYVPDDINIRFGDGTNAGAIRWDSANNVLVIDPNFNGTGQRVDLNGGNLKCNVIGLGGENPNNSILLNANGVSGSTVLGGANWVITYTGTGVIGGNFQAQLNWQGTTASPDIFGGIFTAKNERGSETSNVISETWGGDFRSRCDVDMQTLFYVYYGARFTIYEDSGATHGTNNVFAYGAYFQAIPDFAGISEKKAGIVCEDNIIISADKSIYLEGTAAAGPGDSRFYYDTSSTEVRLDVDGTEVMSWDHDLIESNVKFQCNEDMEMADGKDIILNTTTGTKIGTATGQKLGFFNRTPVAQPSGTGETTGFTAGTGTGVNDDSTFTGNVGSTAYRISDIVKHLKNLGLVAA